jgi:hypothetical protein
MERTCGPVLVRGDRYGKLKTCSLQRWASCNNALINLQPGSGTSLCLSCPLILTAPSQAPQKFEKRSTEELIPMAQSWLLPISGVVPVSPDSTQSNNARTNRTCPV